MPKNQSRTLFLGTALTVIGSIWIVMQNQVKTMWPGAVVLLIGVFLIIFIGETTK